MSDVRVDSKNYQMRTRVIMREIVPGRAVGTIVFSNRAPGAFAQIRAPTIPIAGALGIEGNPFTLGRVSDTLPRQKECPYAVENGSFRISPMRSCDLTDFNIA